MRVLIAGGGTGGHIYPGITIARALQEKGASILFIGTQRGLEREIVPREGFPIEYISVDYFPRRLSWRLFRAFLMAGKGLKDAFRIVKQFAPDICVGTGGYVAGPAVLAAAFSGVPTLIQEQNALPGLTNRWLVHVVRSVALGYEEAGKHFSRRDKLVVTGNPIRPEIVATDRSQGLARLGLKASGRVVLIFGASQGAQSMNEAFLDAMAHWHRMDATFLLVTGQRGYREFADRCVGQGWLDGNEVGEEGFSIRNVRVVPYMYDMPAALAAADLVVCRASASSIAEVTAKGVPAILIPYPHAAENHQEKNARVLEKAGAARVVLDRELSGDRLWQEIHALLTRRSVMNEMGQAAKKFSRPDAVWDIVALIEGIVSEAKRTNSQ